MDINGQSTIVEMEGEMTVFLEFIKDGTVEINFDFVSINPPLCSSESPCNLLSAAIDSYEHQYVGNRVTLEGLDATYIRLENQTDLASVNGFAYVVENRLCISKGLWDFLITAEDSGSSDPLAMDFDRCLIRELQI
jgi:hypothetical protein